MLEGEGIHSLARIERGVGRETGKYGRFFAPPPAKQRTGPVYLPAAPGTDRGMPATETDLPSPDGATSGAAVADRGRDRGQRDARPPPRRSPDPQ